MEEIKREIKRTAFDDVVEQTIKMLSEDEEFITQYKLTKEDIKELIMQVATTYGDHWGGQLKNSPYCARLQIYFSLAQVLAQYLQYYCYVKACFDIFKTRARAKRFHGVGEIAELDPNYVDTGQATLTAKFDMQNNSLYESVGVLWSAISFQTFRTWSQELQENRDKGYVDCDIAEGPAGDNNIISATTWQLNEFTNAHMQEILARETKY